MDKLQLLGQAELPLRVLSPCKYLQNDAVLSFSVCTRLFFVVSTPIL